MLVLSGGRPGGATSPSRGGASPPRHGASPRPGSPAATARCPGSAAPCRAATRSGAAPQPASPRVFGGTPRQRAAPALPRGARRPLTCSGPPPLGSATRSPTSPGGTSRASSAAPACHARLLTLPSGVRSGATRSPPGGRAGGRSRRPSAAGAASWRTSPPTMTSRACTGSAPAAGFLRHTAIVARAPAFLLPAFDRRTRACHG
mmetsp:Transcript_14391/g.28717  ORF Transcript_14391/g.28717 Transcript_14391/m.28717 type:complete len:204 (+) Transcript_14391:306-917(+)